MFHRPETDRLAAETTADDVVDPHERSTADEQDVRRVHLDVLLLGVLAAALRRHVGHGAFEHLEQGLLHAFAGHVAGDRHVLAGLGDLVDFVDVDDAALGRFHVEIGGVEQLQDEVLDVFAHVAGFGEGRGVADGEGHVEYLGERAGEERLTATGRPDEQDVALFHFDFAGTAAEAEPLVVVVNGDGEHLLGALLADHVLIEAFLDRARGGNVRRGLLGSAASLLFLVDDGLAEFDALAADIDVARTFHERPDISVRAAAEGAVGVAIASGGAGRLAAASVAGGAVSHSGSRS